MEGDTTQRLLSVRYTPTDPIPVPYVIVSFPDHVVLSTHEQVYITGRNITREEHNKAGTEVFNKVFTAARYVNSSVKLAYSSWKVRRR